MSKHCLLRHTGTPTYQLRHLHCTHTLVHTHSWLLAVEWMQVSLLFLFIYLVLFASSHAVIKTLEQCFSLLPLHYSLTFILIYIFSRNARKNTGTDSSSGLPSRTGFTVRLEKYSICLEMSAACGAEKVNLPTPSAPVSPPSSFWREIIWLQLSCWLDQFGC